MIPRALGPKQAVNKMLKWVPRYNNVLENNLDNLLLNEVLKEHYTMGGDGTSDQPSDEEDIEDMESIEQYLWKEIGR
ncbi:hypothetical protein R1sor_011135 [Riccia sorocarpa]|uniref:Uncharacterized protein n=1 Tax=Riccia sorocarpa TaxID=122646 RepID=A0ABD3I1V2_9MARC